MEWELYQVLYSSTSDPTRELGEERKTFPKNKIFQSNCPPLRMSKPSSSCHHSHSHHSPGWPLSLQGVQVPPIMRKRSTKLTSLPHFIHDYIRPSCWILVLAYIIFLIVCNIIHIISIWDQNNKMDTDVGIIFFYSTKLPLCLRFLDYSSR